MDMMETELGRHFLLKGDCLDIMPTLPDDSIDSIVSDPPYGLGFMGKKWDALPPGLPWARECFRVLKPGGHIIAFGATRTVHRLTCALEDAGFEIRDAIHWAQWQGFPRSKNHLRPAIEPAILARKPLIGTVAANVLEHGTGALSIDACRFGYGDPIWVGPQDVETHASGVYGEANKHGIYSSRKRGPEHDGDHPDSARYNKSGRWPANLVHFSKAPKKEREVGCEHLIGPGRKRGNNHPTVKPIKLMRWLARLVTPSGGWVLDPFLGSGTTLLACELEGFHCAGIEREPEYWPIIEGRFNHWRQS